MSLENITHKSISTERGGIIMLIKEEVFLIDLDFVDLDVCDLLHIGTAAGKHLEHVIHKQYKPGEVNLSSYKDTPEYTPEQAEAKRKLEEAAEEFARLI